MRQHAFLERRLVESDKVVSRDDVVPDELSLVVTDVPDTNRRLNFCQTFTVVTKEPLQGRKVSFVAQL